MHKVWISKIDGDIDREIESALEWLDWPAIVAPNARVSIKPNLTYPTYKPGVTTSPAVLEALMRALSSRTRNINVVESDGGSYSWPAEEAFSGHGIPEMCRRYGARAVNLTNYPRETVETEIAGSIRLSRAVETSHSRDRRVHHDAGAEASHDDRREPGLQKSMGLPARM